MMTKRACVCVVARRRRSIRDSDIEGKCVGLLIDFGFELNPNAQPPSEWNINIYTCIERERGRAGDRKSDG